MSNMLGLEGKVAFITGAARGQGRSHAVRLARDGADILAVDICADTPSIDYPNATWAELDETAQLVEAEGRKVVALKADVRDLAGLQKAFDEGMSSLGRVDIVLANAGIVRLGDGGDPAAVWSDIIATNLTGAWNTVSVALPTLRSGGAGGCIVITSSTAGLRASPGSGVGQVAYTAAKTGLVGLMKQLAVTLAPESIRVNSVHPTGVKSGMTMNEAMMTLAIQAAEGGDNSISAMQNAMPIDILEPEDISDAVAFVVSDQAKWITGVALPVDAGFCVR
ncbi:MAG TPA: mycofactocin-coupled SDR family oxidoreductase [Acidimicrobiales bacterium]|nr:mycofactocin-coupled SDR family oxidoreductase [Acidimicrobiales bacterium]